MTTRQEKREERGWMDERESEEEVREWVVVEGIGRLFENDQESNEDNRDRLETKEMEKENI